MSESVTLLKTVLTRPRGGAIIGTHRRVEPPSLAPSLAQATNAESKLVNASRARNIEKSKEIAQRTIGRNGSVLIGDENGRANRMALEMIMLGQDKTPQDKHIIKVLKQFENDEEMSEKLNAISAPTNHDNPALGMIRATLGLAPDTEVTDAHTRQAVMSALCAELRQQDVGSCYGTSLAIRVHNRQPGRFLDDMNEIMKTGSLTKVIQGKSVTVPIPPNMSTKTLQKPMKLNTTDGKLGSVDGQALTKPVGLEETPPMAGAMTSLGIGSGDRKKSVDDALAKLRRTRAGDAAIAALPATLDAKTRSILTEVITGRASGTADLTKAIQDIVDRVAALDQTAKDTIMSAVKAENDETEIEVKPQQVVRQLAMDKAGVTEAETRALEEMRAVSAQMRAEMQNNPDGETFRQLTAEYERLQAKLNLEKLATFERLLTAGQDGYTSEEDNRLLRGWEYAVVNMAEIGQSQHHSEKLRKGTTDAVKAEFDRIPTDVINTGLVDASKQPAVAAKLADVAKTLKDEFERIYKLQIQAGYNADIEGEVSHDGSSSRGGTCLYDITDPKRPWPITDQASFATIIGGIAMNAFANLYGDEKDDVTREAARRVAEEMSARAASERFQKSAQDKTAEAYRKHGESDDDLKKRTAKMKLSPWQLQDGDFFEPLMEAYFDQASVPKVTKTPTDPTDLSKFIVGTLKTMWPGNKDAILSDPNDATVPVHGGPHAFNLTPGHPSMRAALDAGDSDQYLTDKFAADRLTGQAQCATKLTDGIKMAMLEDIIPSNWPPQSRTDWMSHIANQLGPDATAADVKTAARNAAPTTELKDYFGSKAELSIARNVPPPMAARGPETQKQIMDMMNDLGVPEDKQDGISKKIVARLGAAASGKPNVDASVVEKTVLDTLDEEGLRSDTGTEKINSKAVQELLRKAMKSPALVIADTNWGGGEHNTMFAIMVNPMTGTPEMIQMNEDGSAMSKMDNATWVNTYWAIPTDPKSFGGM